MVMGPSSLKHVLVFTAFVVCATAHPTSGSETSLAGTDGVMGEHQAGCKSTADEKHQQMSYQQQVIINPPASGATIINPGACCNCSAIQGIISSEQKYTNLQLQQLSTAVSNTQGQLEELVTAVSNLAVMLHNHSDTVPLPEDCSDILTRGANSLSGVYTVQPPDNGPPIQVYCDMVTDGGGWTVFQRRQDGSVDFYRDFESYRRGFGDLKGEFWLGNDKLHRINAQGEFELRVDLTDFENNSAYAVYSTFRVGHATDSYRLTVEGYSGTAGDSMAHHTSRQFSTKDRDNDVYAENCAQVYHGAWWYGECHDANLNGEYLGGVTDIYARGVAWKHWKGHYYSLKTSEMKQRKKS